MPLIVGYIATCAVAGGFFTLFLASLGLIKPFDEDD